MAEKKKQDAAAAPAKPPKAEKKTKGAVSEGGPVNVPPRLKDTFKNTIVPQMIKDFGYTSPMQVPRLEKIVLNMGVGQGHTDQKQMDNSVRDMMVITGQKPVVTRARKAISNFRLRQGMRIGCKVTLRGDRMWHFFDKLVNVVLPRLRDFQGLSPKSFDGRGNFAMGVKEQLVFPEVVYDTVDKIRGMDIIVCTSARNDDEAYAFLKAMGMPLRPR